MPLEKLTQAIEDTLTGSGFSLLSEGAERHGSLEWTWKAQEADQRFYVTLAALDHGGRIYELQIWATADLVPRFTRRLVGGFPARHEDSIMDEDFKSVLEVVSTAAATARSMTADEMMDSYIDLRYTGTHGFLDIDTS